MWIQRLEVTHCAGIAAAAIDLQPGLNVLHGPNELGKSSLVKAVRAALLLQSTSTAAESLRDWHSGEPATVELTFEQEPQRVWRVVKRFSTGGGSLATLEFSRDGRAFSREGRGRGVEASLQSILRWGIQPPGGRGGRRGIPASFITTALLGEQSDVVAILGRGLADDADGSGRARLTEALQALAEDPRFKAVLAAVQEKVGEAFTANGRRRSGRTSPWTQLRTERGVAETSRRNVQEQLAESEAAKEKLAELHDRLLAAKADRDERDAALAKAREVAQRIRNHRAAEAALADAVREFDRVAALIAARDGKVAEAATAQAAVAESKTACAEAGGALAGLTPRVAAARERVRELEDGGGEQSRRLREQEAENERLGIESQLREIDDGIAAARNRLAALDDIATREADVEERNAKLAERRELLRRAESATVEGREALEDLALERDCARYLTASKTLARLQEDLEQMRTHLAQAESCDRDAADVRRDVEALHAPTAAEIERLKEREGELRIANGRLAVGLAVDLTLERAASAVARVDGQRREQRIDAGRTVELEARRDLELELPGVGVFRVRGGGRDLARAAQTAEQRWREASQALFARTGCTSVAELDELRQRAADRLESAQELEKTASDHRIRAEGINQAERDVVAARAQRDRHRDVVAEYLEEGSAVADYIAELGEQPREESAIEADIAAREAKVRELQGLSRDLGRDVDAEEVEVARLDRECAALREKIGAVDAGELQRRVAGGEAERAELERRRQSVATELADIRAEATAEVAQARRTLAEREAEESAARVELDAGRERLAAAANRLARLEGEAEQLRLAVDAEDLESARTTRDECQSKLDALPVPDDEDAVDPDALAHAAEVASACVRDLEAQLRRNEGALEQVGGQVIEEQAQQAEEAMRALDERERDMELEYGAWRLLQETLAAAEQEDAAHLGNALVAPVSNHMSELTGGRYGELAIGPQLDATGIALAGSDRAFAELSVGTREQIALLLRIAIAEALGSFVILDDQLTQSDAGRMAWIRDLLATAAKNIQVIVLTCHPEDYAGDDVGHVVDLSKRLRRSDGAGDDRPRESEARREPAPAPVVDERSAAPAQVTAERKVARGRRRRDSASDSAVDAAAALRAALERDEDE